MKDISILEYFYYFIDLLQILFVLYTYMHIIYSKS